MLQKETPS